MRWDGASTDVLFNRNKEEVCDIYVKCTALVFRKCAWHTASAKHIYQTEFVDSDILKHGDWMSWRKRMTLKISLRRRDGRRPANQIRAMTSIFCLVIAPQTFLHPIQPMLCDASNRAWGSELWIRWVFFGSSGGSWVVLSHCCKLGLFGEQFLREFLFFEYKDVW